MVVETKRGTSNQIKTNESIAYKFRDERELSDAQLADPDYRMKALAVEAGLDPNEMLICSRCHHCRR